MSVKRHMSLLILLCRVGSRAYGTATPDSDVDEKGVFVPPLRQLLGIETCKPAMTYDKDSVDYSLRHYAQLCSKCVPNALELLFCEPEDVLYQTHAGTLLRSHRRMFLSQRCRGPYIQYAKNQLELCSKVPQGRGVGRTALVERYGYDTKFAYHTLRLLQTAEELLSTGELKVRRPNADFLVEVRNGRFTYDEFRSFAMALVERLETLPTDLPVEPDLDLINDVVVLIHEMHLGYRKSSGTGSST